jgi:hypothetical protein
MALESATHIHQLNSTNPAATDSLSQADDHIRLIKSTLAASFPAVQGAVTASHAELSILDGVTSTAAELNLLDGVTATAAELNYSDLGGAVGTCRASKVMTVDANKDVSGARNMGITGEFDCVTLDVSGNADIDGELDCATLDVSGNADIDGTLDVAVCNAALIDLGNWTLDQVGTDLRFLYDGTAKFKLTSGGALLTVGDITASGSI